MERTGIFQDDSQLDDPSSSLTAPVSDTLEPVVSDASPDAAGPASGPGAAAPAEVTEAIDAGGRAAAANARTGVDIGAGLAGTSTVVQMTDIAAAAAAAADTANPAAVFAPDVPGAPTSTGSMSTLANYLTDGWWDDTYGWDRQWFNVDNTGTGANFGTLYYNVTGTSAGGVSTNFGTYTDTNGISSARAVLVREAFKYYEEVLGINFVETTSTSSAVDIFFSNNSSGAFGVSGYYSGNGGAINQSLVNINSTWSGSSSNLTGSNNYTYQTTLHEIGHILGLGHQGDYNSSASYATDATYYNDSWALSMMSYFSQTANTHSSTSGYSYAQLTTAMTADLFALRTLYEFQDYTGRNFGPSAAFAGNTVYGVGTNISASTSLVYNTMSSWAGVNGFTIVDGGGIDTVNFSNFSNNQRIDLTVVLSGDTNGSPSNIGGLTGNMNLGVYTIIENATSGAGNDTLIGNQYNNVLSANAGNDYLYGYGGNDYLYGGTGIDRMYGGTGNDVLNGGSDTSYDYFYGDAGNDYAYVYGGGSYSSMGTGNDVVYGGTGVDTSYGGDDDDLMYGGSGNDYLYGGTDQDRIYGGNDDDRIYGGSSSGNSLYGGSGNDLVYAGQWSGMRADGGTGTDTLYTNQSASEGALWHMGTGVYSYLGTDFYNWTGFEHFYGGHASDNMDVYGTSAANNIYGGGGTNILWGDAGNDVLYGNNGDDSLYGGTAYDAMYGGNGNDYFEGGLFVDTLYGGAGNDVMVVLAGEAMDHVYGGANTDSLNHYSGTYSGTIIDFENDMITGSGTSGMTLTVESIEIYRDSNTGGNTIVSAGTGQTLYGYGGNDTMIATSGSETMYGGAGHDIVDLSVGNFDYHFNIATGLDTVYTTERFLGFEEFIFGGDNDTVTGSSLGETIYAGLGSDSIYAGAGNDYIYGENGEDILFGSNGNDQIYGGDANDILSGGNGDDMLNGGLGIDRMWGNGGNDTYIATSTGDRALELAGGGTDVVYASATYQISANVENLILTSTFNINGIGNGEDNIISGNSGRNYLSGGGGNDTMYGGDGNDKLFGNSGNDRMLGGNGNDDYFVTDTGDIVVELGGASSGYDRVVTSVNYALTANVETMRMVGTADIVGYGNALNNVIIGNSGNNWLIGLNGNDVLKGDISGGNNRYVGGDGIDWSYGGSGIDTFIFADGWDSDRVYNFTVGAGGDRVDLSGVTNITSYADLQASHMTTDAFGNALVYDGVNVVRLMGISEVSLTSDNFLF